MKAEIKGIILPCLEDIYSFLERKRGKVYKTTVKFLLFFEKIIKIDMERKGLAPKTKKRLQNGYYRRDYEKYRRLCGF